VVPSLAPWLLAAALAAPPPEPAGTQGRPARPPATSTPVVAPASPAEEAPIPGGGETVPLPDAPEAWAPAIRRAEEAGRSFQQALQARLGAAMAQGGPAAAVDVCATDAQRIAADAAAASGVRLGRTSDRLRNPANAPPRWTRVPLSLGAGEKVSAVAPLAVDLGPRVGVLLPIGVRTACLACHGPAAGISPKVAEVLARRYPADRATGYAEGDFRGFLWVEVAK
jgi:hypothetical protein